MTTNHDHLGLNSDDKVRKLLLKHGDGYPYAEILLYSNVISKINKKCKSQQRILIMTDKALYNFTLGKINTVSVAKLFSSKMKPHKKTHPSNKSLPAITHETLKSSRKSPMPPKHRKTQSQYLASASVGKLKRRIGIKEIATVSISNMVNEFVLHIPSEYDYYFRTTTKTDVSEIMKLVANVASNQSHKIKMYLFKSGTLAEIAENHKRTNINTSKNPMANAMRQSVNEEYMREKIILWKKKYNVTLYDSSHHKTQSMKNLFNDGHNHANHAHNAHNAHNNGHSNGHNNNGNSSLKNSHKSSVNTAFTNSTGTTVNSNNSNHSRNHNVYDSENEKELHLNGFSYPAQHDGGQHNHNHNHNHKNNHNRIQNGGHSDGGGQEQEQEEEELSNLMFVPVSAMDYNYFAHSPTDVGKQNDHTLNNIIAIPSVPKSLNGDHQNGNGNVPVLLPTATQLKVKVQTNSNRNTNTNTNTNTNNKHSNRNSNTHRNRKHKHKNTNTNMNTNTNVNHHPNHNHHNHNSNNANANMNSNYQNQNQNQNHNHNNNRNHNSQLNVFAAGAYQQSQQQSQQQNLNNNMYGARPPFQGQHNMYGQPQRQTQYPYIEQSQTIQPQSQYRQPPPVMNTGGHTHAFIPPAPTQQWHPRPPQYAHATHTTHATTNY